LVRLKEMDPHSSRVSPDWINSVDLLDVKSGIWERCVRW
jgi:hypothetical protein